MAKSRREQLEAMLAEDPNDAFLGYGLAMDHVSAGDDAGAIVCFQTLLERNPDYVPGWQQLGQTLARLGREAEARDAWRQGIDQARRQGNDHAAHEMQGMLDALD
ncbi:MAG: tetratricopeptide repeat protein [Planctomycetia bacterium]|nr:tetratricopeptide repeat protein [Planctomycetia bacterium]